MKVTIDTKEDSYDDLKKVLHLIADILQKKGETGMGNVSGFSSSQQTTSTTDTSNLMSLFDDPISATGTSAGQSMGKDIAPDFSSFLNLAKLPEKKEAMPRVEIF